MRIIDSHHHLWQVDRGDYRWLTPELTVLYRDYLPQDMAPIIRQHQIEKTVLVQAADSVEETNFLLQLAADNPEIAGVVGWLDMQSDSALLQLEVFCTSPYFKGIRPMIQDIADPNWMLKPELAPVFEALVAQGLTFDALVTPAHLAPLLVLLDRYPDLKVVIDHGAKPDIANQMTQPWFDMIEKIALTTNALCKLSGLVTEAGEHANRAVMTRYMQHLYQCFGSKRLMWGSDWPVVNLACDYHEWVNHTKQFLATLPITEQQDIWANNAEKFYQL